MRLALLLSLTGLCWSADVDSTRGARVFEDQGCIQCHSINGRGGRTAPDLGRAIGRSFTPATLAGTMWNHAPAMWQAMKAQGTARPVLTEQSAGDLFAYFYAARFFDVPGDAGRGKHKFQESCSGCHPSGPGQWHSVTDPIALASAMWNHNSQMRATARQARKPWPQLSGQDLTDLLVFLRNSPEGPGNSLVFRIAGSPQGEELFRSKGCQECHGQPKLSLNTRLRGLTLTGIAAEMWNHAPRMSAAPPQIDPGEMRDLLGFVWWRQFLEPDGSAARGRRVFVADRCSVCHDDASSGAPHLQARAGSYNGITMIAALWGHGPAMLEGMQAKGIHWPRFQTREMSDLITYLNTGSRK